MKTNYEPLPKEEVIKAVERKRPVRIPLIRTKWWGEGLWEEHGDLLKQFDKYPEDSATLWVDPIRTDRMNLSWSFSNSGAHDTRIVIDDWAKLDEFIEKLPDPAKDPQFEGLIKTCEQVRKNGTYLFFGWWNLFFERPWMLRGMENVLTDYYVEPEHVHKLHTALCDHYIRYLDFGRKMFQPEGFWTSDDLGHQTQPMMSPAIFHEFLFPYYARLGTWLRENKIHWWLHSCGNNTPLMTDLITAGVKVFHPVQKHTMDEISVSKEFGKQITFLAGIDVQHTLREKDPQGVRDEVRFLIDTFDRPEGGMCIAAGNGIVAGTPLANIEAFLDEAFTYGSKHRRGQG